MGVLAEEEISSSSAFSDSSLCDGTKMGSCVDSDSKKEEEGRSTLDGYASNVRVVDWSVFSVGVEQSELQFSLEHDFSLEDCFDSVPSVSGTADLQSLVTSPKTADGISETSQIMLPDNTDVINEDSYIHSSKHSGTSVGTGDLQNWDNSYPGWKYDFSTAQWYQVGTSNSNTGVQSENWEKTNGGEKSHDGREISDVLVDSRTDSNCEESVVQTVTESLTNSMNAMLNSGSREITEYPLNMVFDPRYPGWYYDTNYQQWNTLESYTQSIQVTGNVSRNWSVPAMNDASLGSNVSERKSNSCGDNGGILHSTQNLEEHHSEEFHGLQVCKTTNNTLCQPTIDEHHPRNSFVSSGIRENHIEPQKSFNRAESTYTRFTQNNVEQIHNTVIPASHFISYNPTTYLQYPLSSEMTSSNPQFSGTPKKERSSEGRPPHGLVTFGFGGKFIIMKQASARLGSQVQIQIFNYSPYK